MSDLQTLIDELEAEKANLLRLIDQAVKEQEFLNAHFHSEALGQINRRLQTLKNLDDDLYDKKYLLAAEIENLKKRLEVESTDKMQSMFRKFIDAKEKELSELNRAPKMHKGVNGEGQLRHYLEQFVKGKIRRLRIVLSKNDKLLIDVRNTKEGIKLLMPNIKKLRTVYLLTDERLSKLRGLGFSLNDHGDKAIIVLTKDKASMTEKIMQVISIIVFEIFYFKELGSEASIEILAQ